MIPAQYSLFSDAPAGLGEYDEMVNGTGQIRAHWRPLVGTLQTIPQEVLARLVERVYREYQDTALAYSFDSDRSTTEMRRPFDLLPMVIPESEWRAIEVGLVQRARLLDRLLADLYGPRRMLAEGLVPPMLVYANPGFLRSCCGIPAARAVSHLHLYCADLVRGPDGAWRVLADRLQTPAGMGFALQNRTVLARVLPEIFRAQPVRRVEPFFELWRESLAEQAPRRDGPARIVVMTPGPYSAAYFEHVFLARQLGAKLVEGADLTVRDQRVYIKTLSALQPVDLILRFIDDDYCDPLELRGNSLLGVAGLLQAVRAGTVLVANALGSSVADTPALRPFLPRLAEALLGEDLIMPSVETQWLGDPSAVATLADRLGDVVIKPVFGSRREEQAFIAQFASAGSKALLEEVHCHPQAYVAEARLARSVMPIWTPGGLVPRPLTLRVFLAQRDGTYFAMPGGFTQVPSPPANGIVPLGTVLTGKDTWVLCGDDGDEFAMHRGALRAVATDRSDADELLSRSADDLFWLGRYAERLDNAARTMRGALARIAVDQLTPGQQDELRLFVRILADLGLVDSSVAEWLPDCSALRRALTQASSHYHGLQNVFRAIQRIAQSLRDRMSGDMWQVVTGLLRQARERLDGDQPDVDRLIAALDHLVAAIAAFGGMMSENMTRGSGWRFLDLGRRVERGIYSAVVLKNALASRGTELDLALSLSLELFDSAITYRSRHLSAAVRAGPVLDLVLGDESNPRSLCFQLQAIVDHLTVLATSFGRTGALQDQALVAIVATALHQLHAVAVGDTSLARIAEHLNDVWEKLTSLSDHLTRAYFSQVQSVHSVGYEGAHI